MSAYEGYCDRMGIWSRLVGGTKAEEYGQWVEPQFPAPVEVWERRLRGYGRRCARELEQAGVPKWRSQKARSQAYRDAFWLVSVDVEAAERYLAVWSPGGVKKPNTFGGHIRGYALILSSKGGLFSAKTEMWFPDSGSHDEDSLDAIFHPPSQDLLRSSPWAVRNTGRWRTKPDVKIYGAVAHSSCSEFKCNYPPYAFSGEDPGKGSSMTLSKFVKSGGQTQWPRSFGDYYGI